MTRHPCPLKIPWDELQAGARKSSRTPVLLLYFCPHLHLLSEYTFFTNTYCKVNPPVEIFYASSAFVMLSTSLCCFSYGSESALKQSSAQSAWDGEGWSPPDRWGLWGTDGLHDSSREVKPCAWNISSVPDPPQPQSDTVASVRAKLSRERGEAVPVAVADPRCFCAVPASKCAASLGICHWWEGDRGYGADRSSSTSDSFYHFCARFLLLLRRNIRSWNVFYSGTG